MKIDDGSFPLPILAVVLAPSCVQVVIISGIRFSINRPEFSWSMNEKPTLRDWAAFFNTQPWEVHRILNYVYVENGLFENRLIAHKISYHFVLVRNGWTKCFKFFARFAQFFVVELLSSSPSSSLSLVYCFDFVVVFFLTNACDDTSFEPHNKRMNKTTNETNASQTPKKRKKKTKWKLCCQLI